AAPLLASGLASYQLEASGRGFSFKHDERLDMRFDPGRGRTAAALLASLSETELAHILFEHGEERPARRIARRIVERRQQAPLVTTTELVDAIKARVPPPARSPPTP